MSKFIERLTQCDCCAVSDALDALGLPPAVDGLLPLSVPKRIAGRVKTVKLTQSNPEKTSTRHLGTATVDSSVAGDVIVVSHASRSDCAGWGGVLSTGAKLRGVNGVIVDGAARDIDQAKDLDLPLYARKAIAVTARGRVSEENFNCPINVKGVTVTPGDYVIADSSGVAFIPANRADEVIAKAEMILRKEQLMVEQLHKGLSIADVMGLNYENMLEHRE
jgi:regulator of RNase E activity RraA